MRPDHCTMMQQHTPVLPLPAGAAQSHRSKSPVQTHLLLPQHPFLLRLCFCISQALPQRLHTPAGASCCLLCCCQLLLQLAVAVKQLIQPLFCMPVRRLSCGGPADSLCTLLLFSSELRLQAANFQSQQATGLRVVLLLPHDCFQGVHACGRAPAQPLASRIRERHELQSQLIIRAFLVRHGWKESRRARAALLLLSSCCW